MTGLYRGRDRSRPAHRGSARRRIGRRLVPGPDHRLSAHPADSRRRPDLPAACRALRVPPPFRGRLFRDGSGIFAPARRGRPAHGSERGALDQLFGAVSVRGEDRAGKINAVSGAAWAAELRSEPQDYAVVPGQPWLDGFSVGEGLIRQFVAMPLGAGDTVEEQLTGRADVGECSFRPIRSPQKPAIATRMTPRETETRSPSYSPACERMKFSMSARMKKRASLRSFRISSRTDGNCPENFACSSSPSTPATLR